MRGARISKTRLQHLCRKRSLPMNQPAAGTCAEIGGNPAPAAMKTVASRRQLPPGKMTSPCFLKQCTCRRYQTARRGGRRRVHPEQAPRRPFYIHAASPCPHNFPLPGRLRHARTPRQRGALCRGNGYRPARPLRATSGVVANPIQLAGRAPRRPKPLPARHARSKP